MFMGWLVPVMEVCGEEGVLFFFFFKESCVRESGGRQRGRRGRCVCVRERERVFLLSFFFSKFLFLFIYLYIFLLGFIFKQLKSFGIFVSRKKFNLLFFFIKETKEVIILLIFLYLRN